jgi:hypothetical protein
MPGQLPFSHLILWLWACGRARRPSIVCSVTTTSPLEASFMPVAMGPDPDLLESQAEALDVTLRLCMISAESAGSRRRLAPFVKQSIARKLSGNGLHHPSLPCGDFHLSQHSAQCASALVRQQRPGCRRERERGGRDPLAHPPPPGSESASDTLLSCSLDHWQVPRTRAPYSTHCHVCFTRKQTCLTSKPASQASRPPPGPGPALQSGLGQAHLPPQPWRRLLHEEGILRAWTFMMH